GSRGYHKGCRPMRDRFAAQARDAYGALDYLASQTYVDARRLAAIGFSLGAITINEIVMARAPRPAGTAEFKALASLYGRCRDMKPGTVGNTPLLQIIPEKDRYAPDCIERSKTIRMEAHVFPGAYHGFDQPQITQIRSDPFGNPMLYDSAATEQARALVRAFLEKNLK
ncbi:MAG TPA: dienelactone hydrolase family protein, partial [Burkholderiales bacterium]|nr:dienelactone hydrolase family protein [Burkholderiales bacterium]